MKFISFAERERVTPFQGFNLDKPTLLRVPTYKLKSKILPLKWGSFSFPGTRNPFPLRPQKRFDREDFPLFRPSAPFVFARETLKIPLGPRFKRQNVFPFQKSFVFISSAKSILEKVGRKKSFLTFSIWKLTRSGKCLHDRTNIPRVPDFEFNSNEKKFPRASGATENQLIKFIYRVVLIFLPGWRNR